MFITVGGVALTALKLDLEQPNIIGASVINTILNLVILIFIKPPNDSTSTMHRPVQSGTTHRLLKSLGFIKVGQNTRAKLSFL